MKVRIKLMPAIMAILSALYFAYVVSGENTTLAADAVGGDPGGKVLPMVMAMFLFFGFIYITLKERPDNKEMDPDTRRLFVITFVLSVLYVLLIRQIGFIILSSILLYSLEYIYTTIDEIRDKRIAVFGGLGTVAVTVAAYYIMRIITRNLMSFGRSGVLPKIFASTTTGACISLLYVALITLILAKTVCLPLNRAGMKRISDSGLITLAAILFLYVVFKQFFNVNLAPGILNF